MFLRVSFLRLSRFDGLKIEVDADGKFRSEIHRLLVSSHIQYAQYEIKE